MVEILLESLLIAIIASPVVIWAYRKGYTEGVEDMRQTALTKLKNVRRKVEDPNSDLFASTSDTSPVDASDEQSRPRN